MRFWDSSALVPLLIAEPSSERMLVEYELDPDVAVWWAAPVECASALTRVERDGTLAGSALVQALQHLDALADAWREVEPSLRVRQIAIRLLRVHALRGADALQLAAAVVVAEDHPGTLPLVTLDDRLALAATREGFPVVGLR